jgi:hypothetical protein
MEAAKYDVGEKVKLADGRVGIVARINAAGRYDVNIEEDPVAASTRGHAALRSNVNQPAATPDPAYDVPAERLTKV